MPWYRLRSGTPYHVVGDAPARSELIGNDPPDDAVAIPYPLTEADVAAERERRANETPLPVEVEEANRP